MCSFTKSQIKLINAGKKLQILPSSNAQLLNILVKMEQILYEVKQSLSESMLKSMHPIIKALIAKEMVRHPDMDVNISVAHCISEIMRIMAPENPYNNEQMKDFFELVVTTFENLYCASGGCYTKMTRVLKIFSIYRLPVLMLDLELDGRRLIVRLFEQFLTVADNPTVNAFKLIKGCPVLESLSLQVIWRNNEEGFNSSVIVHEMEKIMTMIVVESEELMLELRGLIATTVKKDKQIALPVCWQLAEKVLMNYAVLQKPHFQKMSRDMSIALYDYSKLVARICKTASENDITANEVDDSLGQTIPSTTNTSNLRNGTTHKIKLECPEEIVHTVRCCQLGTKDMVNLYSEDEKKTVSFDDPPMPSKVVTDVKGKRKRKDTPLKKKARSVELGENLVGSRIKVWWPDDEMYYQGVVKFFECNIKRHKLLYDDGVEELLNLKEEKWELVENLSAMTDCALEHGENLVGRRIKVWWPLYRTYYEGVVEFFDSKERRHKVLYDDGDEELICLKGRRWEVIENAPRLSDSARKTVSALPKKSSSQSNIICCQRYKVKRSTKPILEAIFKKHGDIAAECVFKTADVRSSFLEVICDVFRRIQTNDVTTIVSEMEKIKSQVSEAETANINVSWLRAHLADIDKKKVAMKTSSLLMEMKANAILF